MLFNSFSSAAQSGNHNQPDLKDGRDDMRKSLALILAGTLILAGCGGWRESRINPGNWFGKSRSAPVTVAAEGEPTNPLLAEEGRKSIFARPDKEDLSVPVAKISELRVEPTPNGAIIYASGIASRQGAHKVELRPVADAADNTLEYTLHVLYPVDPTPAGSEHSRTIQAAVTVSEQSLRGIRTIRVSGAENARETRRR
ncbi:MAG: hypothetical protein ACJARR_003231 [Pseudophaeobacter arcticus]|jgi:hypothetical protein